MKKRILIITATSLFLNLGSAQQQQQQPYRTRVVNEHAKKVKKIKKQKITIPRDEWAKIVREERKSLRFWIRDQMTGCFKLDPVRELIMDSSPAKQEAIESLMALSAAGILLDSKIFFQAWNNKVDNREGVKKKEDYRKLMREVLERVLKDSTSIVSTEEFYGEGVGIVIDGKPRYLQHVVITEAGEMAEVLLEDDVLFDQVFELFAPYFKRFTELRDAEPSVATEGKRSKWRMTIAGSGLASLSLAASGLFGIGDLTTLVPVLGGLVGTLAIADFYKSKDVHRLRHVSLQSEVMQGLEDTLAHLETFSTLEEASVEAEEVYPADKVLTQSFISELKPSMSVAEFVQSDDPFVVNDWQFNVNIFLTRFIDKWNEVAARTVTTDEYRQIGKMPEQISKKNVKPSELHQISVSLANFHKEIRSESSELRGFRSLLDQVIDSTAAMLSWIHEALVHPAVKEDEDLMSLLEDKETEISKVISILEDFLNVTSVDLGKTAFYLDKTREMSDMLLDALTKQTIEKAEKQKLFEAAVAIKLVSEGEAPSIAAKKAENRAYQRFETKKSRRQRLREGAQTVTMFPETVQSEEGRREDELRRQQQQQQWQ